MARLTERFGYAQDDAQQDDGDTAPLMDEVEVQVRRDCPRCEGRGHLRVPPDGEQTRCMVCGALWTRADVKARGHIGIRSTRLPCHHEYRHAELVWQPPTCPRCGGDKRLYRWMTLGEWLDWLLSQIVFEDTSAVRDASDVHDLSRDVSRQTTARRRAV